MNLQVEVYGGKRLNLNRGFDNSSHPVIICSSDSCEGL